MPHPSRPQPDLLGNPTLLGAAVEAAGEAVLITTPELDQPGPVILYANPAFARMTGYAIKDVIGRSPRFLQGPKTDRAVLDRMRRELTATGAFRGEAINYRKDGSEYVFDWLITAVRDPRGRVLNWVSVQRDITEQKRAEERQRLLLAELQHRVRNTLGVIRALAWRTAKASGTTEVCAHLLAGRLDVFARVQDAVTRDPLASVDLEALVASELHAQAAQVVEHQVSLSGPPVRLQAKAAETLGLAIHELATNAVEHGALSNTRGRLRVCWRVEDDWLVFDWIESGAPGPVATRMHGGFGMEVLEKMLAHNLGAITALVFGPEGLRCRVELPFAGVVP